MVDRVYQRDLPRLRARLEELRDAFAALDSPRTNWVDLKIVPLLDLADSLEARMRSPDYAREFARLPIGMPLFHADLVYLRTSVKELQVVLDSGRA